MKNSIFLLIVSVLLIGILGFGQSDTKGNTDGDSSSIDNYYIDFSIPDLSAFSLLGLNASQVSRPGNIKELSIAVLNIADKDGNIIPGVAIEWSPSRTLASKSLSDYRRNRLLRAFQMSLASVKEAKATKLGFGLRWVPIDKSDPLESEDLEKEVISYLAELDLSSNSAKIKNIFSSKVNSFFTRMKLTVSQRIEILDILDLKKIPQNITLENLNKDISDELIKMNIKLRDEEEEELNGYIKEAVNIIKSKESSEELENKVSKNIEKAKEEFEKKNWNAEVFHLALGIIGNSVESTWKDLKLDKFSCFSGYAFPLANNSQIIIQAVGRKAFSDDSKEKWYYSLGSRYLIGNSKKRFSLEGLYSNEKNMGKELDGKRIRFTIGGEFKLSAGLWLEVAIGTDVKGKLSNSSILSLFNIKYALQKKQRFEIS